MLVVGVKNIVSFGELEGSALAFCQSSSNTAAGATYGILPMVNTWNYLTAYMLVSYSSLP